MGQLSFQNLKIKTAVPWSVSWIGLIMGYVLQLLPSCKAFQTSHSISATVWPWQIQVKGLLMSHRLKTVHKWRPLFIRLRGDFTLGWNTACWLWVRGQMIGQLFSDKRKIKEYVIQLQQHTELTVILFSYHFISLRPFPLSSLSLLLHTHFWHLLSLLVKLDVERRANTEMSVCLSK